ncbi:MAG: DNA polymerase III subunit delta [Rhodopirellula sp.]|uniref:DNA polymerase III subunit delta n=1 Tax=Rhodopirellula TaxID=265488 RepID=UPI000C49ACF5|nr:DNA polymerase III subunit delta [Rhodopirellula sp. UBA1907]MAP08222.1 DNA polymerase III subunit delta [Rhodopirellula sp.]|tara:strand:+ start:20674 stop:21723 length:1050 start_codon:yes stop_codon:yes gene_type:complete
MPRFNAFEYLSSPESTQAGSSIGVVYGVDSTLRKWAIDAIVGDSEWTQVDGEVCKWSDLRDDLATASLFDFDGGDKRTLVVRSADKFLSNHRPEIEKYVSAPGDATRFVLELESLASNTRVYKAVDKSHLLVACTSATDAKLGITAASRRKFLTSFVADRHKTQLAPAAADALVEMLGEEIGMLDTEIAKLALYVDVGGKIEEPLVRDVVAGWQGKTVWQITDAIAAGDAAEALRQLDKLFSGGQRAIALLPQIAWSLRRLGMTTAAIEFRERSGRPWQFEDALAAGGIRRGFEVQSAKKQLQSIGRERAKQLLPWLLDADLRLKGTHSAEGRDRFLLEQLILKLARQT